MCAILICFGGLFHLRGIIKVLCQSGAILSGERKYKCVCQTGSSSGARKFSRGPIWTALILGSSEVTGRLSKWQPSRFQRRGEWREGEVRHMLHSSCAAVFCKRKPFKSSQCPPMMRRQTDGALVCLHSGDTVWLDQQLEKIYVFLQR